MPAVTVATVCITCLLLTDAQATREDAQGFCTPATAGGKKPARSDDMGAPMLSIAASSRYVSSELCEMALPGWLSFVLEKDDGKTGRARSGPYPFRGVRHRESQKAVRSSQEKAQQSHVQMVLRDR